MIFSYVRLFKAQDRMDHDSLCLEYSGPPRLPHLVFNQRENRLGEKSLLDVPLCFPFDLRHVTLASSLKVFSKSIFGRQYKIGETIV